MEVTSGWQTEAHPRERLTVADEREHALFYLAEVIYRVVPALYEEIALWMQTVFGLPPELGRMPLILRFGSWVGGDMDGNSDVHAKAIRETLQRQHQRIISAYFQECRTLADKLSQSAGRVGTSARARGAHRRVRHPGAEGARGGLDASRPDALPDLPRAGGRAPAHDLRRPAQPLRVGGPVRARHPARRLEPARQQRPACGPVRGRAAAVPRAHLRLPPGDARRAPARHGAPRGRRTGPRPRGLGVPGAGGPQRRHVRFHLAGPRAGGRVRRSRPAHARGVRGDAAGAEPLRRARHRRLHRERNRVGGRRPVGAAARALGQHHGPRHRRGAARRRAAHRDGQRARGCRPAAALAARGAELPAPSRGARRAARPCCSAIPRATRRSASRPRATRSTRPRSS